MLFRFQISHLLTSSYLSYLVSAKLPQIFIYNNNSVIMSILFYTSLENQKHEAVNFSAAFYFIKDFTCSVSLNMRKIKSYSFQH